MAKTLTLDRFSPAAKGIIGAAQQLADKLLHREVTPLHLLVPLIEKDDEIGDAFYAVQSEPDKVKKRAVEVLARVSKQGDGTAYLNDDMLELLRRAEIEAGAGEVMTSHLLHALAQEAQGATRAVLEKFGVGPGAFRAHFERAPATAEEEELADDEEGAALLRDFASEVRAELASHGDRQHRQRGRTLLERLFEQFDSADGIPGLIVTRDNPSRLRLHRQDTDKHLLLAWESDSGAVALTTSVDLTSTARYVWNPHHKRWLHVEKQSGLYSDLRGAIREHLFPELAK